MNDSSSFGVGEILVSVFVLAVFAFAIVSLWKVFEKAGEPGWACIVLFYNVIVMLKIGGRPWWWLFLLCIPLVGFIIAILVNIDIAKRFGKDAGFGVGLALLGIVFYPILAFGDARYLGGIPPAAAQIIPSAY